MERWREELYYDTLMHYGVRGMKKGVRRYQNADGSLTAAGERRYLDPQAARQMQTTLSRSQQPGAKRIDPRAVSQIRERYARSQQTTGGPAQGSNRVVTSTRQRESLESGDRNRRIVTANREGHMQRVQDVQEEPKQENRPEARPKTVSKDTSVKEVAKRGSGLNKTANRPQSRPKIVSEDKTEKEVEKKPMKGYGSGIEGQTAAEFREKQKQEQLKRAASGSAASAAAGAKKSLSESKKNSKEKKKTKTLEQLKKKGERYIAKKVR